MERRASKSSSSPPSMQASPRSSIPARFRAASPATPSTCARSRSVRPESWSSRPTRRSPSNDRDALAGREELLTAATRALASLGAEVRFAADAENCVRHREPGEACARAGATPADAARLPFVIEIQGLPNLLHELAHVVLLGRVEKDH